MSLGLTTISNASIRQGILNISTYTKSSVNDFLPVDKEIDKLETILESHLMMDREKLIANPELKIEAQVADFLKITFKFINYDALLKDERLGYSLIKLIKMRFLNMKVYEAYITLLEKSVINIEEELKILENK